MNVDNATVRRHERAGGEKAREALAQAAARAEQIRRDVEAARRAHPAAPVIVMHAFRRIEQARERLLSEIEAAETYIEETGLA